MTIMDVNHCAVNNESRERDLKHRLRGYWGHVEHGFQAISHPTAYHATISGWIVLGEFKNSHMGHDPQLRLCQEIFHDEETAQLEARSHSKLFDEVHVVPVELICEFDPSEGLRLWTWGVLDRIASLPAVFKSEQEEG